MVSYFTVTAIEVASHSQDGNGLPESGTVTFSDEKVYTFHLDRGQWRLGVSITRHVPSVGERTYIRFVQAPKRIVAFQAALDSGSDRSTSPQQVLRGVNTRIIRCVRE